MKLQTNIPLQLSENQFGYEDRLLLLGSCFAENIGKKLTYYKFQSVVNPFGILFHPIAIERVIEDAVLQKEYTKKDVFQHEGIWKSFRAHSDLNALDQETALSNLMQSQKLLLKQLKTASQVFITLGTTWVYRHIESNSFVANCHKVQQKEFNKELLSVDEIAQSLSKTLTFLKTINSHLTVTFTVSPVRHLKDGFVENMRSKAHLISAVHEIVDQKNVLYFPAYELMMDELRDYRFYASDMLHPSEQAIVYIWEQFVEVYAFAKAKTTMKKVDTVQKGLAHRPFNEETEAYKAFRKDVNQKRENLISEFPFMSF